MTAAVGSGVAVRVAGLCLDRRGRLAPQLLCSTAARAGLLVDLALAGRLTETDDSIELDDSPTGSPPADLLLREVTAHPGASLDDWLERPRPTLRDVAGDAVGTGRWELRRGVHLAPRFTVLVGDPLADVARDPTDVAAGWTPADAAVTAIGLSAGLLGRDRRQGASSYGTEPVPDVILDAGGSLRWLLVAVTDHLADARWRYALEGTALGSGGGYTGAC